MSHLSKTAKVFWGEGLFLRPQHFQRQDSYHEARLQDMAQTLHPYAWGMRRCRLDPQALIHGRVRLLELSLVFPDGEVFDAPAQDSLPEAISLQELPAGVQATTLYVALALPREEGDNIGTDHEARHHRYRQLKLNTPDLFTDAADAELAYLGKAARVLTDEQPRDAYVAVPFARVRGTSSGGFELDDNFMPPATGIAAAPALLRALRNLLDALQAKVDALYGLHRQPSQHIIEFRSGDIASFWLLHTLNASFGALGHLLQHPDLHPERLHQELVRMAGALLTFSHSLQLSDLPGYRHAQPEAGFTRLFEIVRELLDTVISARYFQIALHESKPSFHLGRLDSQRLEDDPSFYIGVSADMPAQELVQTVPVRFKVGAPDDVEQCVLSALSGVKLIHAAQVPAPIPVRPGSYYFQLDARGPLYERMLKAQSIMIYVPAGMDELKLELMAVTA